MANFHFSDGTNTVDVDVEFDYKDDDRKVESRHRTRTGKEYVYKFGDYKRFKFSVKYLDAEQRNRLNKWWLENTGIAFGMNYDLAFGQEANETVYLGGQTGFPNDLHFNSAGTIMYVMGLNIGYQYTLSDPFQVSSAVYASKTYNFTSEASGAAGIFFGDSGQKCFIVSGTPDAKVFQYSVGTAYDLSTCSYTSVFLDVSSKEGQPQGLFFSSDGTKLFIVGAFQDKIHRYNLSTAWDLSTASWHSEFLIKPEVETATGVFFIPAGTTCYVSDQTSNAVYQYDLTTAWDLSTIAYSGMSLDVSAEVGAGLLRGVVGHPSGKSVYIAETGNDTITQYNLVHDVRIVNKSKPINQYIKPYLDQFQGTIELETYK